MEKISDLKTTIDKMQNVLEAYEKWEADLISDDRAWVVNGYELSTPRLTQELWDRLIDIQTMRNEALGIEMTLLRRNEF